MACDGTLCMQITGSILIIILAIPLIPIYLILLILPSIILLSLLRCICCCASCRSWMPTVFDFYLYSVFWPYTWLLCWIKVPFARYRRGYQALYLGKLKRNHLHNNYHELQQNARLRDIKSLNNDSLTDAVRVICISDTHGRHSWLTDVIPDGHILIHGGDITFQGRGGVDALKSFNQWMKQFRHKYKFVIGGNHDRFMPSMQYLLLKDKIFRDCVYLDNNSFTIEEYENLCIFGCGWSPQGSDNNAFQALSDHILDMNNSNVDILLAHSDLSQFHRYFDGEHKQIKDIIRSVKNSNACIHVCGHFHARYSARVREKFYQNGGDMMVVNCSSLDGRYVPLQAPVVFDIQL